MPGGLQHAQQAKMAQPPQRLRPAAEFIRPDNGKARRAGRRDGSQRPHMAQNDILFFVCQLKMQARILQRPAGMGETVKMLPRLPGMGMPVVQKQIVEETCPGSAPPIPAVSPANPVAQIGYLDAVGFTRSIPMLYILIHGIKNRMRQNVLHTLHVLRIVFVFSAPDPGLVRSPLGRLASPVPGCQVCLKMFQSNIASPQRSASGPLHSIHIWAPGTNPGAQIFYQPISQS